MHIDDTGCAIHLRLLRLLMHMMRWLPDNFDYVFFVLYICTLVLTFHAVSWIPLYVVSSHQTHGTVLG